MATNRAVLKVNDSEYDILRFNYKFQRDVDRRGRPCSVYYGGEMSVQLESTDDTGLFYQMIHEDMPTVDGSIEVLSGDDEVCVRRIEFKEAYIYAYGEDMQSYSWLPMTTNVSISPMRMDFNNLLKIDRRWPDYNGWGRVKEEVTYVKAAPQSPPTPLVMAVKGEKTALPNTEVEYSVTDYSINVLQSDKDKVKWSIKVGTEGGNGTLQSPRGETVKLKMKEEWIGKEITVMPYLKKPNPDVSVKTMVRCKHIDGASAIAEYIVAEIKTNTRSQIADSIRYWTLDEEYQKRYDEWRKRSLLGQMLSMPEPLNLIKAKVIWTERVFAKRPWDHKPKIKEKFGYLGIERTEYSDEVHRMVTYKSYYHKYKDYDYYYDVWSNIHYGYLGLSVGFDKNTLLNGADWAQIIDSSGGESQDAGDDKTAIKIGFALYYKYGRFAEKLTAQDVLDALDAAIMTNSKKKHICLCKQD